MHAWRRLLISVIQFGALYSVWAIQGFSPVFAADPAAKPLQGYMSGISMIAPSDHDVSLRDALRQESYLHGANWTYIRRLPGVFVDPGTGLGDKTGPPIGSVLTSIPDGNRWTRGVDHWRIARDDDTDLILGNSEPTVSSWGGSVRMSGIALTHALTAGRALEDQWQYGVRVGALNYSSAPGQEGGLDYGPGATDVLLRYGVDPDLTLESQLQWAPDMVTMGLGGQYSAGLLGAWRMQVARATHDLYQGWRYRLGYDVTALDGIQFSWLNESRSGGFSDLQRYAGFALDSGRRSNLWKATVPLGRWGKISGSYEEIRAASQPLKQHIGIAQQFWYSPNLRVSLRAQREQLSGDYGLRVQLSMPIH